MYPLNVASIPGKRGTSSREVASCVSAGNFYHLRKRRARAGVEGQFTHLKSDVAFCVGFSIIKQVPLDLTLPQRIGDASNADAPRPSHIAIAVEITIPQVCS